MRWANIFSVIHTWIYTPGPSGLGLGIALPAVSQTHEYYDANAKCTVVTKRAHEPLFPPIIGPSIAFPQTVLPIPTAKCTMKLSSSAPCQCVVPGSAQTKSPALIRRASPPRGLRGGNYD